MLCASVTLYTAVRINGFAKKFHSTLSTRFYSKSVWLEDMIFNENFSERMMKSFWPFNCFLQYEIGFVYMLLIKTKALISILNSFSKLADSEWPNNNENALLN